MLGVLLRFGKVLGVVWGLEACSEVITLSKIGRILVPEH